MKTQKRKIHPFERNDLSGKAFKEEIFKTKTPGKTIKKLLKNSSSGINK
jgi:hypothetical protein